MKLSCMPLNEAASKSSKQEQRSYDCIVQSCARPLRNTSQPTDKALFLSMYCRARHSWHFQDVENASSLESMLVANSPALYKVLLCFAYDIHFKSLKPLFQPGSVSMCGWATAISIEKWCIEDTVHRLSKPKLNLGPVLLSAVVKKGGTGPCRAGRMHFFRSLPSLE